jgi:hypothetical protein
MSYRDQLAEIRKSAEAVHDDAARTVAADAFAERAIAAVAKSLDEESDDDVSGELALLSKATVQKDAEGKVTGVLVPAPPPEAPSATEVGKARLMKQHAQMDALRVKLEKSEDEGTKEIAKNLAAAQSKLMQVAGVLNLDPNDDGFRWDVSSAIGMLQKHIKLMQLLGETGAFKTDATETTTDGVVEKRTIEKGWPRDLAATDLENGKLVEKASIWGPDSKVSDPS